MTTNQLITKIGRQRVLTALANVVCSGTGGASTAAQLSFGPQAGFSATNAQDAIVEAKTDAEAYADAGLALKANLTDIETITQVSITGATILDDTAFGKLHVCTGTTVDYNLTLPTPSGSNAGKSLVVKGDPALTKNVTCIGTIEAESNRALGACGVFVLKVNAAGTSYQLLNEIGSWVTWTTTYGGFSTPQPSTNKYFRVGKKIWFYIRTSNVGTSNATTLTFTLPFNASSTTQIGLISRLANAGTTQTTPGMFVTRASSQVVDCYRDGQALAWTSSGAKWIEVSGEIELL